MVKISVVVPVYNCENTIIRCVDSILNQTFKDFEIILVNDGSTDSSENVILSNYKENNYIKYYKIKNSGVSFARNFGIKKSLGKYVYFIDSDDFIDPDVLNSLFLKSSKETLIGINYSIDTTSSSKKIKSQKKCYRHLEFIENIILDQEIGVIWRYLFKRELLNDIKFDVKSKYLEDTLFLFNYILKNNIKKIEIINTENFYHYMINTNSFTSSKAKILSKCKSFIYTLDEINKITNFKFNEQIKNKKIILLEKELRLVDNKETMVEILKNISVDEYTGKNLKYLFFSHYYRKGSLKVLKLYYFFRKLIKKFLNK